MTIFCAAVTAAQNFSVCPSLQKHVGYLCSDSLKGRAPGSQGERLAAEYLYNALSAASVEMLTDINGQDFTISEVSGDFHSCNIVGIVEGSDDKLKDEYIVVGANIDAPGVNRMTIDGVPSEQLFAGADANASGVAIMVELARLAVENSWLFPRSIVFVGFGAGEKGSAGAWYFANRAFGQMENVKAMVDLDMLGHCSNAARFQVLSQVPPADLDYLLSLVSDEPVVSLPQVAKSSYVTSDYIPFYEKEIPFFYFSTGKGREYHTVKDVPSSLSYADMELECNYLFYFLKTLSSLDDIPAVHSSPESSKPAHDVVYSFSQCDRRPQFFHSDERHFLKAWVYKYLKYPESAIQDGTQGTVVVGFTIEKNGEVTDVHVENGVDERLDAEAVRVISVSPKWIPGQISGSKVRTRISVPVEFRLRKSNQFGIKK